MSRPPGALTEAPHDIGWLLFAIRLRTLPWLVLAAVTSTVLGGVVYPAGGLDTAIIAAIAGLCLLARCTWSRGAAGNVTRLAPIGPWEARTERIHLWPRAGRASRIDR